MKSKICPICGTEFTPKSNNAKYCSDKCRKTGRKVSRKNWELKTDYREKQKERSAEYRQEKREQEQEKEKNQKAKKTAARTKTKKKPAKSKRPVEKMSAALGKGGNTGFEYWNAFKEYDIELAEKAGKASTTEVNGISVYNGDFENLVIESIKDNKSINID